MVPAANRQRGGVLLVLLALLATLVGAFLLVFNAGQQASAKARLVNAADAAALSAAVWEARSLNLQAYMNRAIVANEVAIAQFVSLQSWSRYMNQAVTELATVTSVVPYLGPALRALAGAWRGVDRGLQVTLPPAEGVLSVWNTQVLARVQSLADAQAPLTAQQIIRRNVADNLPQASLSAASPVFAAQNLAAWQSLTRSYGSSGTQRERLRGVVMAARDGFTRQRNWNASLGWVAGLKKRGGTDLIGYGSWRGLDTVAVHTAGWLGDVEVPIAWGGAESRRQADGRRGTHGGSWSTNPRTTRRASAARLVNGSYRGLPAYRDIATPARREALQVRSVVELALPAAEVGTSETVLDGAATVVGSADAQRWQPQYPRGQIYALGAARVFYQRPVARRDGRAEYPSLFNPYWEARLTSVQRADRQLAAPGKGLAVDPLELLP